MDPELRDALNELAADLRGEIRSGDAETRAYVDASIQGSAAETRAYIDERVGTSAAETRRHFDVVGESLRGEIRALAEAMALNNEGTQRRFGAEAPRFSPRQSDLLWVVGTISQRQAPVLKRIYEQMMAPRWVMAFGTCASCGGFYDNYATVMGIDTIIPVDVYIPGCPPRPDALLDGLLHLQKKVAVLKAKPRLTEPTG